MKKILILTLLTVLTSCHVFAKKNLFGSLPDGDNVERVYIGGPMLKMAGYISSVGKYSEAVKSAKAIEVYNIENPTKKQKDDIMAELDTILKKYVCEEVVHQKSGSEINSIYMFYGPQIKKEKGELDVAGMLIVNIEKNEINLVYISGTVDYRTLIL